MTRISGCGSYYPPSSYSDKGNYKAGGQTPPSFDSSNPPYDYSNMPYSDAPPSYTGNRPGRGTGGNSPSPAYLQVYYNINTTNNILVNNQFPMGSTGNTGGTPIPSSSSGLPGSQMPTPSSSGLPGSQTPSPSSSAFGNPGALTGNTMGMPTGGESNPMAGQAFTGGAGTFGNPGALAGGAGGTSAAAFPSGGAGMGAPQSQGPMNFITGGITGNTGSVDPFTAVSQAQQIASGGVPAPSSGAGMPGMNPSPIGSSPRAIPGRSAGMPSGGNQMGEMMQFLMVGLLSILSALGGDTEGTSNGPGDITEDFVDSTMNEDLSQTGDPETENAEEA